jgi:hypothetical protein
MVGFLRLSRHLTLDFFPSSSSAADSAYSAETSAARATFRQLPWLIPSDGQNRNAEAARPACGKQGVNGKLGVWQGGFMNMNPARKKVTFSFVLMRSKLSGTCR